MKVVLFAFTNFGYDCVEYIHKQKKYEILVVTSPSDKGEPLNGWRSVLSFCRKKNISFIKTDMHKIGVKVINKVISFSPDIIFSCNYPLIIPHSILHSSKYGGLNFHGGILPYYRGCLSGVWSILNNENESGVTLHYMDENIDSGDIVEIRKVKILPSDTAISLYEKVRILSYELFKEVLTKLPVLPRYKQDTKSVRYYDRKLPNNGILNWNWTNSKISQFIRAMYFPPFKPAEGIIHGKKIFIEKCVTVNNKNISPSLPGNILKENNDHVIIQTGNGLIKSSNYYWG